MSISAYTAVKAVSAAVPQFFWVAGCDHPEGKPVGLEDDTPSNNNNRSIEDIVNEVASDVASDAASAKDQSTPEPDQSGPVDSLDDGPEVVDRFVPPSECPEFPLAGIDTPLGSVPCGDDGFISDMDDTGFGVCTNFSANASWLFQFSAEGIGKVYEIGVLADQIEAGPQGDIFITGQNAETFSYGVGKYSPATGSLLWRDYPMVDDGGIGFIPGYGKGILWHEDSQQLFVATSNFIYGPEYSYDPGTLLIYGADLSTPEVVFTKGINPTSVGLATLNGEDHVVVVNTGNYNSSNLEDPDSYSNIVLVDPTTHAVELVLSLEKRGVGIAGEISIIGAQAVFGASNNSGEVILADLEFQTIEVIDTTAGDESPHFITVARQSPDGMYCVAGDFNPGIMGQWDISASPFKAIGDPIILDDNLGDFLGISDAACRGGKFVVAVGPDIRVVE